MMEPTSRYKKSQINPQALEERPCVNRKMLLTNLVKRPRLLHEPVRRYSLEALTPLHPKLHLQRAVRTNFDDIPSEPTVAKPFLGTRDEYQ